MALRNADYSLSDEQRALRESFGAFLARECPGETVRKAEPLGFDERLWQRMLELGAVRMGLPEVSGGDGAGLVELVLVAEQVGRHLVPVPVLDAVVAARALDRCGRSGARWLPGLLDGTTTMAVALHPAVPGQPQLVPAGALAEAVLGRVGDELVLLQCQPPPPLVPNQGAAPLAWWDLAAGQGERHELLGGPLALETAARAVREWKLLMAAAQVGIAEGALSLAVDYAGDRLAFGAPIASYQGVSHPLVDSHIAALAARRLVWKAAWFADHEPDAAPHLIPMAFTHACRAATRATSVAVHTQGGLGVTLESDVQLFFRRAKGWAAVAGSPTTELGVLADALYGPARPLRSAAMDFSVIQLDDDTRAFEAEVRAWLDTRVTDEVIDAEWTSGDGHNAAFYRALGERGWAFPTLAADEGGAGLDDLRTRILSTEMGRRHVPITIRNTTALVMPAVRQWMTGPQRDDILRRAAAGEAAFCLGYTEPEAGSDLAAVRTRAVADGDEWVINGQKMFTTGAHLSDYCFLLARTDPDVPRHKGLTMFLVPMGTPGIEIQAVQTLGGERTNMVFYDEVRVADDYRLGPPGSGWAVLHGPLNAEHRLAADGRPRPVDEEPGEAGGGTQADMSTYILAVHEPAVRAAVQWARTPAPQGQRPIDDPRIRERLADIELGVVVSQLTPGPQGRVLSADTMIRNTAELVDLIGPAALIPRGHPSAIGDGWIEYAHRFAQACAIYGGTTEVIRNLIAERFLGLGRRR